VVRDDDKGGGNGSERRRSRKVAGFYRRGRGGEPSARRKDGDEDDDGVAWEDVKRTIESYAKNISKSSFYKDVLKSVSKAVGSGRKLREIVCYGIGDVARGRNAQFQMACATLLRKSLKPDRTSFFDPALSKCGDAVLRAFEFEITKMNVEGKRAASEEGPTLFFMPHCDLWLYSNVLWANWTSSQLKNVIIVGNSFSAYKRNSAWGGRLVEVDENCVFRLLPLVCEVELSASVTGKTRRSAPAYAIEMAFNNTSVMHFPSTLLESETAAGVLKRRPSEFSYASCIRELKKGD